MPFDPTYVRLVLNENFEDAKARLLEPLMAIHYAHLVMLADTGIVTRKDARAIRQALDGIDVTAIRSTKYDGVCEDLFFHLERMIAAAAGDDAAGHLHTARSRNDIDMTMYRMALRDDLLGLIDATIAVRGSLLDLASRHAGTIFAAHTHTQPAQPTTVAHYLLGVIEERERDAVRLFAAYAATNRCPLGACAITGTGFPIDRSRTSDLLGFDRPTVNTYGSIATVDYLLESISALVVAVIGLGRFVQDMLLWSTQELGYLRLAEGFVQSSSIMPQKRNPVALEHARALASKAFGQAQAIANAVHNTPFGDVVDTEDDLQPLIAATFNDAIRATSLVAAAMAAAELDAAAMRHRAANSHVTVTELADTLARDHDMSFRAGHAIASRVVRARATSPAATVSALIAAASREVVGREIQLTDDMVSHLLSPERFVAVRKTLGGPSQEVTAPAITESEVRLAHDQEVMGRLRDHLTAARQRLRDAAAAL